MNQRTVLITGASRGIGRGIALRLARDGFDIVVHCRSRREEAEAVAAEIAAMDRLAGSKAAATMEANGFPAPLIIALASEVAKGRRAMASKRHGDAIAHFKKAAEMQKSVPYNEPPFWYYPVNQSLGAALFEAGRLEDAKTAFQAALFEAPEAASADVVLYNPSFRVRGPVTELDPAEVDASDEDGDLILH